MSDRDFVVRNGLVVNASFAVTAGGKMTIGNSTVNLSSNSSLFSIGNVAVNSTVIVVGNSTVYVAANSTLLQVSGNVQANSTALSIGNSTVNAVLNSSSLSLSGVQVPTQNTRDSVAVNGTDVGSRSKVNFSNGSALITVSGTDNSGSNRVDLAINIVNATAAQLRSMTATKVVETSAVATAMAYVDGGDTSSAISPDFTAWFNAQYRLTANCTVAFPTSSTLNNLVGRSGVIDLYQDATGGRTVTWASGYKFDQGAAPTPDTVANRHNGYMYHVRSNTEIWISLPFQGVR